MSTTELTSYLTRDTILKLLFDAEIAKVSNVETALQPVKGSEYLDLEHLEKGVQSSQSGSSVTIGNALPRAAVSQETWDKRIAWPEVCQWRIF